MEQDTSSLKGAPEMATSLRLAHEMVVDGFVSAGDALMVKFVDAPVLGAGTSPNTLPAQSVGYQKGAFTANGMAFPALPS